MDRQTNLMIDGHIYVYNINIFRQTGRYMIDKKRYLYRYIYIDKKMDM